MRVALETTRTACDHCGEVKKGIILSAEFANNVGDSIQLCDEHAEFFAKEILRNIESTAIHRERSERKP